MSRGRGFWSNQFTDADYLARWKANCAITEQGCWLWKGFVHRNGYGGTSYRGKGGRVHRFAYQAHRGEAAPADWDVCHTCDNRLCINPLHLFAAPRAVNIEDMRAKGRGNNQKKTHCPRGHSYAEHGKPHATHPTWRLCAICERGRMRVAAGWPPDMAYSLPAFAQGAVTPFRDFNKGRKRNRLAPGKTASQSHE